MKNFLRTVSIALKDMDSDSMRFGFVAGAICIILIFLAYKIYIHTKRAKLSRGVVLPSSLSTVISTRAIFDLVEIEMNNFTNIQVLKKSLYKIDTGHSLNLDIAYDLSQGDFPEVEKRLKEHLFKTFKDKLGLENITNINIEVRRGVLD